MTPAQPSVLYGPAPEVVRRRVHEVIRISPPTPAVVFSRTVLDWCCAFLAMAPILSAIVGGLMFLTFAAHPD
jgi:hypothetical protein